MNLRDYEWFKNPRGLQNKGPFRSLDAQRYLRPQMGWAALVVGGDEYVDEAAELVDNRVVPIVRIHRSNPGAVPVPEDWYETVQAYLDVGVRWFELYSEPNTPGFWPQRAGGEPAVELTWENPECIEPLMDNWLDWAERLVKMGAYPAFPALATSGDRATSTVYWLDAFVRYLSAAHGERFARVVGSGLWAATHPDIGNHFYQEPPGGPPSAARPYYQQSASEGGWHFEYPYDPIIQREDPGRTVFRGAGGDANYGDARGLVAAGEAFNQLLRHHLDAGPVPVVATSGGISPLPAPGADPLQPDAAYPPYSRESHAEATLAMWKWIANQGPPWFFGLCLADETVYYEGGEVAPAILRMDDEPPTLKEVPGLDTGGVVEEPPAEDEEEFVIDGEATPVDEAEEGSPVWLADAEHRAELEREAAGEPPRAEPAELPPALTGEGEPGPGPERLQTRGLDHDAEEMIVDAAEGVEHTPDRFEEGEIPDWLADELPPEELAELMGEGSPGEPETESLERLVAIDAPEEPVDYDEADVDEVAAEAGRPESEVEPDYDDLTGQLVDAWQEPETAGVVPGLRLEDLPEDMQEELAARTGAQLPEDLAEMTEEDEWEENAFGEQPEPPPSDLEEMEDVLLEQLGGEAIPPQMEEAEAEGRVDESSDRATSLTSALFEAGDLREEEVEEADEEADDTRMPWKAGEERPGGAAVPPAEPVAHPHQGAPGEDIRTDLIDMTGDWSEEGETPLGEVPAGDLPSAQEVRQRVPDEAPLSGEWAADFARDPQSVEIAHHWLVFAPGVDPEWFFEAGWRWWQEFRPTVAADWQQIALIPAGRSVALTLIAPSEQVEEITARVHTFRPDVIVDVVEADTFEDVRREFEWRAARGRRLG